MTKQSHDLESSVAELKAKLDSLSIDIRKSPKKGRLEILASLSPLISGVLISGVATIATILYNERQVQLAQFNALDKYRAHLSSDDPLDREFGYQAFVALGYEDFVIRLIGSRRDDAGTSVLVSLVETGRNESTRREAQNALLSLPEERRIRAIVNVIEYGSPDPKYDRLIVIADDIYYGQTQSSLRAGALLLLVNEYIERNGAQLRTRFLSYLARIEAKDATLTGDESFLALLREAASDPAMIDAQEAQFRHRYLASAFREAERIGIRTPLGVAVVFESRMHGSWNMIRDRTQHELEGTPASGVDERQWVTAYLRNRKRWLETHRFELLRASSWRSATLLELAESGNWELLPPFNIGSVRIME